MLQFIILTKNTSTLPILGTIWNIIVEVLGIIMNYIYLGLENIGLGNIGFAIIIFTLVTRILMFPTSVKQQKTTRMTAVIQPELKAIQDKYKGKNDNASMMAMQAETKAVYEKYGTSMTAGCLPLLLQMPIIFALYRIIMNIPAYVPSVYNVFSSVCEAIGGENAAEKLYSYAENANLKSILAQVKNFGLDDPDKFSPEAVRNLIIDFLYKLNPSQWQELPSLFPEAGEKIREASEAASKINDFFGINLSTSPSSMGFVPNVYWIIPILAGVLQWYSASLMQKQNANMSNGNEQSQQMMKSMNMMMPLMSVWFCFTFASGIGLYWCASSLFMILQQLILNFYFSKQSDEEMLKDQMEKVNRKRAKKGLPPINERSVEEKIKNIQAREEVKENKRKDIIDRQKEKTIESTDYYNKNAKPGSIASKVDMVRLYNEKNDKK